jgi:hypothetical protein
LFFFWEEGMFSLVFFVLFSLIGVYCFQEFNMAALSK